MAGFVIESISNIIFSLNIFDMGKVETLDDIREFDKFSNFAKKSIIEAYEMAREEESVFVTIRHLVMAILLQKSSMARKIMEKVGVDIMETIRAIRYDSSIPTSGVLKGFSDDVKKVLVDALLIANEFGHVYAGTEHILLSILKVKNQDFVEDFENVGINYKSVKEMLLSMGTYQQGFFGSKANSQIDDSDEDDESALSVFSEDMNEREKNGKYMPVYGRESEIERLIHILSRKTKSNPILVGEAGVGKTAIVEGLVQRINNKEVPLTFQNKKVVSLDIAGILAGSKIRGDVEERILDVVREASDDPNIILFIDEVHMIVGAGSAGQGSMDIANILKPHLTNGSISVIGSTTYNEYQQYFESDNALSRRFQPVFVSEISIEESIEVMKNIRKKLEDFHGVSITDEAIETAVKLSQRYINDRYLPDKAIDLIDEAAAGQKIAKDNKSKKYFELVNQLELAKKMKLEALDQNKLDQASRLRKQETDLESKIEKLSKGRDKLGKVEYMVSEDSVRKVISKLTKIPIEKMGQDNIQSLLNLNKDMKKEIIGQSDAVDRIISSIKRAKVGIGDTKRPLASFMFVGPSGVGKTQTAKVLAKSLFGREESIIQLDMSEYMEQHSVSKLIGAPPGYIGFQEGGQFTEKVRRNPYSVILLDEIEKAHPDLLNILLQILEEGSVKDGKGRFVSFKNAIIIMTSNLGVSDILNSKVLGFSLDGSLSNDPEKKVVDSEMKSMREKIMSSLKSELRPEFLNRIDDIVIFRGLSDKDMIEIVKLEIDKLNKRLDEKSIVVVPTVGAIRHIGEVGMSKEYGARNIRRKIQELVENPLANLLLEMGMIENSTNLKVIKLLKTKSGIELKLV
jgi:ATP-dependent Clp protease ATP-binding subunit ClpC